MSQINKSPEKLKTYEGGAAGRISPEEQLSRAVMSCLLWEDNFYEDGIAIADRISQLVVQVDDRYVSDLAIKAREEMNLRHVPLLLCRELARTGRLDKDVLAKVIQRPDELTEFLAIYWKDGRCPISAQVKKGLAKAFTKFGTYQLTKYNRKKEIKLRDVLFLCHAKPKNTLQAADWKNLIEDCLPIPYTWETELSSGKNKKTAWEELLKSGKLGSFALIRNLRNMDEADVNKSLVKNALENMNTSRILPFRFIAAARYAPQWESELEQALFKSLGEQSKLFGKTVLLIDVSGSMEWTVISVKSEMDRLDAANGLAICVRELCANTHDLATYTFSNHCIKVPNRRGFALADAIKNSQHHGGTYLGRALKQINDKENYDRIIVITDEQSHDDVINPKGIGYMINVAPYKRGVGYGSWTHINGWSDAIIRYIQEMEKINGLV